MDFENRDQGLSEVIGFILIVALIAIIASLYLAYAVPTQGRDAEIVHMGYIADQFAGLKVGADSLIVNRETGTTLVRSFDMGTGGGATQGSFFNLPLVQPIPSGGSLVINGRNDIITLSAEGFRAGAPHGGEGIAGTIGPNTPIPVAVAAVAPTHIYIIVNTSTATKEWKISELTNWPQQSSVLISSSDPAWSLEIRLAPVTDIYNISGTSAKYNLTYDLVVLAYNQTSVGTVPREFIINKSINKDQDYVIDVMDFFGILPGIGSGIPYPGTLTANVNNGGPTVNARYQVVYPYTTSNNTLIPSQQLGSLEYRSENRYWIQQDYYYQSGGIFLQQVDGMAPKILPLISAHPTAEGFLAVDLDQVTIEGSGSMGSTGSVQVQTMVRQIDDLSSPYANARRVALTISSSGGDAPMTATMWGETFRRICVQANRNGVPYVPDAPLSPVNWISVPPVTGNSATLLIEGPYQDDTQDVELNLTRINLAVTLEYPSGGVIS